MHRIALVAMILLANAGPVTSSGDMKPDPLRYVSPSREFRTLHTSLDLDVDLENQRIAGSVTHTFRSLRDDLRRISLNCVGLNIKSVKLGNEELAFEYPVSGDQTTSWLGGTETSEAGDQLVVVLREPAPRGTEFDVTISYDGAPKMGLYWIQPEPGIKQKRYEVWSQGEGENNRYWIPCYDYPNEKSTFEGRFRVKKGYYALSNGALVGRRDAGDKEEFYWKLDQPQVSYLIMLAVSRYNIYEDQWDGIPLMFVVPPETDEATARRGYGLTADMMKFYSERIGIRYPYAKYAQVSVQNYIHGGMENTSATVMNMRTLYDEREALTRDVQGLVAHELAHQWWGDMLTSREWSHMWLNEGFATYYESLYREYHDGDDAFRYAVHERHRTVLERDKEKERPIVTDFYNRQDARNNANIYIKGSSVLHMLRFIVGDDLFHETMLYFGTHHQFECVETSDLARAFKDVTGENLDWFFEQWVYLAGHPEFRVSKEWNDESKILHMKVEQTQKVGGLVPLFRTPVDIEITCGDTAVIKRVMIESGSDDYYFDLPARPDMVIFDKGDWILKTLNFKKPTRELIHQLEHGDYMARVRAAVDLGSRGSDDGPVAALRRVIASEGHYGLRREAALSLGRIGGDKAAEALFAGLREEDALVRLACTEALGDFKRDERVADQLMNVLASDRAYGVRVAAVNSMVKIRSRKAAQACYLAMKQESDRSGIRNAGIEGLVDLEQTDALNAIKKFCTAGNDRDHRHTAISAYARLASKLEKKGDRERAAEFLSDMLDDWYLRTRRSLVSALSTLGEPVALGALRRMESDDPIESLRVQARRAVSRIESNQAQKEDVTDFKSRIKDLEERIGALEDALDEVRSGD